MCNNKGVFYGKKHFFLLGWAKYNAAIKKNILYTEAIHPDHKVTVVDSKIVKNILDKYFPDLANVYNDIQIPAAKSDIGRLAILFDQGGWYIDCDMSLRVSVNYFESFRKDLYLFTRIDNNKITAPNAFMGGIKGHRFFSKALNIITRMLINKINNYSVFKTTGPMAVIPAVSEFMRDENVMVQDLDYTLFDVINDGKTKGSWTWMENCGVLINKENPCIFNSNSSIDRIGSIDAFYFYIKIFNMFPETKDRNFKSMLRRLAIHHLDKNKQIKEEVKTLINEYLDPNIDQEIFKAMQKD